MSEATGMLSGLAALVVGADDIGLGIAQRFEREGAEVAVLEYDESLRGDPRAVAAAVTECMDRGERLDVLVCNLLPAARPIALEAVDAGAFGDSLRVLQDCRAAMQAAFPELRESRRGRILLVGHRYGENVAESLGAYNTAAWGLVGLMRTAAVEWGPHQITTNLLLPVARTTEFEAARARRPAVIDRLVAQLPLRRVGDPERDVGGAAAFLASDAACFVNGEVLYADGGQQVAGPVLNPARFVPMP